MNNYKKLIEIISKDEYIKPSNTEEKEKITIKDPATLEKSKKKYSHRWRWFLIVLVLFFGSIALFSTFNIMSYQKATQYIPLSEENVNNLYGYWNHGDAYIYIDKDVFHFLSPSEGLDEIGTINVDIDNHRNELDFSDFAPQTMENILITNNGESLFFYWLINSQRNYIEYFRTDEKTFTAAREEYKQLNEKLDYYQAVLNEDSPLLEGAYGSGRYYVGPGIPAGIYQVRTTGITGYVGIYSDETFSSEAYLSNEYLGMSSYILLRDGEFLEIGMNTYLIPLDNALSVDTDFLYSGTYLVGKDIAPGVYEVISTGNGYWGRYTVPPTSARASEFLIENKNFEGTSYVTVNEGEYLKLSENALINLKE